MRKDPTREEEKETTKIQEQLPDRLRIGVTCVPTFLLNGQRFIILTPLPLEDFDPSPKRERIITIGENKTHHTTLTEGMLCVPSGAHDSPEGTPDIKLESSMLREIKEELGIELKLERLKPFPITHFVEQYRSDGIFNSPNAPVMSTLFVVTGFTYELTEAEFAELQLSARRLRVSIITLPVQEALGFENTAVRPATIAAIQAYASLLRK
ncbi:MAG: hypothetical protein WAU07_05510 [Microgenomates group bacterium]